MTKKSQARQERDAQARQHEQHLKTNMAWDDLIPMHNECALLLQSHGLIGVVSQDKELLSYIGPDQAAVIETVTGLKKDLVRLSAELKEIRALHADRTGGARTDQDMLESFDMAERYQLFMTRHEATALVLSKYLAELIGRAETRRDVAKTREALARAEAQAQDPHDTTPIDVVVKEPTGESL